MIILCTKKRKWKKKEMQLGLLPLEIALNKNEIFAA